MKTWDLRAKTFLLLLSIIGIFSFLMFLLGARMIEKDIIVRSQKQVKNDLRVAHSMLNGEIEEIAKVFDFFSPGLDLEEARKKMGLDYLFMVEEKDKALVKSEVVLRAFSGRAAGGIRIIGKDELLSMGEEVYRRCAIDIRPTPKARPLGESKLEEAMAIGYALPIFDSNHSVKSVLYGGKIINRDFALVDKIRNLVFEDKLYDGKPLGTVTIFLRDIRIATNVLDREEKRAIGTTVSETVYHKVFEGGKPWLDRAFVVTDWYLTAYEPLRNINDEVIGILYVGILEKPFVDLKRKFLLIFLVIILLVAVLAAVLSYILADSVSRPVRGMLEATDRVSKGDLSHRVGRETDVEELNRLSDAFNNMTVRLKEREEHLRVSNEKLSALNKNYLDLISFVAHELKGILSSAILNAYSVRDGFLGMINFKQRRAMDSMTRNLDYLDATVKNFLNLSRIEKGEMSVTRSDVLCKEDIFDPAVENFSRMAADKEMEIINRIEPGLKIKADAGLLQIVANNLISNAVKYATSAGKVILTSSQLDGMLRIEVFNEGKPLTAQDKEKLFKKFSRLETLGERRVKGTGLGLFIIREIVERHQGSIWIEPRENGNAFIFQIKREETA